MRKIKNKFNKHRLVVGVGADIQARMSDWYISQEKDQPDKIILDSKMRYRISTIKGLLKKIKELSIGEYEITPKDDRKVAEYLSEYAVIASKKIDTTKSISVEDEDWDYIMTTFIYLQKARDYIEKTKEPISKELKKCVKSAYTHFENYVEYLERC